jgi:hypothetical protein
MSPENAKDRRLRHHMGDFRDGNWVLGDGNGRQNFHRIAFCSF